MRVHVDTPCPDQAAQVRVAEPIGTGHDHFVAGVADGGQGVVYRVLGPVGDQDDVGRVVDAASTANRVRDGLSQRADALGRRVAGASLADGPDGRLLDVFGRIEVRLTDAQAHDVHAPVGHPAGAVADAHRRRFRRLEAAAANV